MTLGPLIHVSGRQDSAASSRAHDMTTVIVLLGTLLLASGAGGAHPGSLAGKTPALAYFSGESRAVLNDAFELNEERSQPDSYWDWVRSGRLYEEVKDWFLSLGRQYGVNPIIFGGIYVGAIPFFSLSIAWLIRNLRSGRSPAVPALCASFCLVSAYLYLFIAGKNIPLWVYLFLAGLLAFGVYSALKKIRAKLREDARA